MPYIGEKISTDRFNSLDEARQAAKANKGTEAIIEINNGYEVFYELRKITTDSDKTGIYSAKALMGNLEFPDIEKNERVVGCSLAESSESLNSDIFVQFPDRSNWAFIDRQSFNSTLSAIADSKGTSEAERKKQAIELITSAVSDPVLKEKLQGFLAKFDLDELISAEAQGLGGDDLKPATDKVVGTSEGGHYVNSILSSIREIIRENRFTPEVMEALKNLESAPLHEDLKTQKTAIIRSALQDIAFPNSINQHSKGTCAPTTIQIMLALQQPERYLDVLTGLVSPGGEAAKIPVNKSGDTLKRVDSTMTDDSSGRSISSRIIQAAFMEYANDADTYDNAADKSSSGSANYGGLGIEGTSELFSSLTGRSDCVPVKLVDSGKAEKIRQSKIDPKSLTSALGFEPALSSSDLAASVEKHLTGKQEPVSVGITWGKASHQILVTAMKDDKVYFMNPWGQLQTMPRDEFEKRLFLAIIGKDAGTEKNKPDVSAGLPHPANDLTQYKPIEDSSYKTIHDRLGEAKIDPKITVPLEEKFEKLKLAPCYLDFAFDALKDGKLNNSLLGRINSANTGYEVQQLLRLAGNLSHAVKDNILTEEQANKLLETLDTATAENLSNLSENLKSMVEKKTLTQEESSAIWTEVMKPTEENSILALRIYSAGNLAEAFTQAEPLVKKGFLKAEDVKKDLMTSFNTEISNPDSLNYPLREKSNFYQNCAQSLKEMQILISSGIATSEQINELTAGVISSGDSHQSVDLLRFSTAAKELMKSGVVNPDTLKADIARIMEKPKEAQNIMKVYSHAATIIESSARLTSPGGIKRDDVMTFVGSLIKSQNAEKAEKWASAFSNADPSFISVDRLITKGVVGKDALKIMQDAFKIKDTDKLQKAGKLFVSLDLIYTRAQSLIAQKIIKPEELTAAIDGLLKNKNYDKAETLAKLIQAIDVLIRKDGLPPEDAGKSITDLLKGNAQNANTYIKTYEEKYKGSDDIKKSFMDFGKGEM